MLTRGSGPLGSGGSRPSASTARNSCRPPCPHHHALEAKLAQDVRGNAALARQHFIDPIAQLRKRVATHGTQRQAAKALGVSTSLVNEMLSGKRGITPHVLGQLGLKRVVVRTRRAA